MTAEPVILPILEDDDNDGGRLVVLAQVVEEALMEPPRVFKCPVEACHRVYARRADLKVHVKQKHTDLDPHVAVGPTRSRKEGRPYVCPHPECPSGYTRKHDLERHLQQKHAGYKDPLDALKT